MNPPPFRFALDLRIDVRWVVIVAFIAATLATCAVDLAWLMHDAKLAITYAGMAVGAGVALGALGLLPRRAVASALVGVLVGVVLAGGVGLMLLFDATVITAGQAIFEQLPSLLFGTAAPSLSGVVDAARAAGSIALLLLLLVPVVTAWLFVRRARAERGAAWSDRRGAWLAGATTCVVLAVAVGTCVALDPFEHARIPLPDEPFAGYYAPGATPTSSAGPELSRAMTDCDPSDRLPDGRIHCVGATMSWHKAFKVAGVVYTFPALGLGALLALLTALLELLHARFLRAVVEGRDPQYVAVADAAAAFRAVPSLYAGAPDVAVLYHRADAQLVQPIARVPAASGARATLIMRLLWAIALVAAACAAGGWFLWAMVFG